MKKRTRGAEILSFGLASIFAEDFLRNNTLFFKFESQATTLAGGIKVRCIMAARFCYARVHYKGKFTKQQRQTLINMCRATAQMRGV